jgi:hypothetical protein
MPEVVVKYHTHSQRVQVFVNDELVPEVADAKFSFPQEGEASCELTVRKKDGRLVRLLPPNSQEGRAATGAGRASATTFGLVEVQLAAEVSSTATTAAEQPQRQEPAPDLAVDLTKFFA